VASIERWQQISRSANAVLAGQRETFTDLKAKRLGTIDVAPFCHELSDEADPKLRSTREKGAGMYLDPSYIGCEQFADRYGKTPMARGCKK